MSERPPEAKPTSADLLKYIDGIRNIRIDDPALKREVELLSVTLDQMKFAGGALLQEMEFIEEELASYAENEIYAEFPPLISVLAYKRMAIRYLILKSNECQKFADCIAGVTKLIDQEITIKKEFLEGKRRKIWAMALWGFVQKEPWDKTAQAIAERFGSDEALLADTIKDFEKLMGEAKNEEENS